MVTIVSLALRLEESCGGGGGVGGHTLASFLPIICLDYVLRKAIYGNLSLVHTCEISTVIITSVSTRMFTLATYACLVRVTLETFSSAIFIDREEICNISHSDWLNSCFYACACFTLVPAREISVTFVK